MLSRREGPTGICEDHRMKGTFLETKTVLCKPTDGSKSGGDLAECYAYL